ncbi:hypothetical protein [Sinomonas sp. ASV322]|uniref:hypothetical protein n=1 Tax=Sinomonas sp. ASV322 TaxID=3041920 RepID=UPI0027DDE2EE|nr:hypothetical protein [Sinomonas sp. ASV322]MDQ4501375.1 hypothetical protein [Sinomonas sp. ASV322]
MLPDRAVSGEGEAALSYSGQGYAGNLALYYELGAAGIRMLLGLDSAEATIVKVPCPAVERESVNPHPGDVQSPRAET